MDFVVIHKSPMHPNRQARTRWQVKHVTMPQELLGTTLIQHRTRIDLGRDLERHPGRNVGLDQAGDYIHRWPLGGKDQVNTGRPRLLRDPGNQFLNFLADDHHHVGEFINHHDDEGKSVQLGALLLVVGKVFVRLPERVQ